MIPYIWIIDTVEGSEVLCWESTREFVCQDGNNELNSLRRHLRCTINTVKAGKAELQAIKTATHCVQFCIHTWVIQVVSVRYIVNIDVTHTTLSPPPTNATATAIFITVAWRRCRRSLTRLYRCVLNWCRHRVASIRSNQWLVFTRVKLP